MPNYTGGSVTAKITLDTSDFNIELDKITERVAKLKTSFKSLNGTDLGKTVDELKNKIKAQEKEITNLQKELKKYNTTQKNTASQNKRTGESFKTISNNAKKATTDIERLASAEKGMKGSTDTLRRGMQYMDSDLLRTRYGVETVATSTNKLNDSVGKTTTKTTDFHNNINKGRGYINSYNKSMKEVYNTFLSIRTIGTMIGGMYAWQGLSELAQGISDTVKAKSEMESQLSTLGIKDGGIILFNKALDDTAAKFQKINKYQVGETVSSIGLEFQLSAKEMAESMDVVSMITSEYIRAGRNSDEAALAVKDILQGEFQRLSRETGIGKKDLQEKYDWDGNLKNVTGLMEALRKAGKDRHWDVFAKKATSLNDVLQITKNRFSEFGAELVDRATPLITGAFNTILDVIESLKSGFDGLNGFWQNSIIFGGIPLGIGGILTALTMITKGFGLADIATVGWGKSILTMIFNLEKAEVGMYGFRKSLVAAITGTKASELANIGAGKALAARVLGVNKATLAEHGFFSALVESKATLKGQSQVAISAAAGMGNLRQKIIYLAKGEIVADKASATWGKTIKSLITSTKLWRIALMGVASVGIIAWLSSVATWADKVKKNVEGYKNVVDNGDDLVKEANSKYEGYVKSIDKLNTKIEEYKANNKDVSSLERDRDLAVQNRITAYKNLGIVQRANAKAKEFADANETRQTDINTQQQNRLAKAFEKVGNTSQKATELSNDYYNQVLAGNYYINKGMDAYENSMKQSTTHLTEHALELKKAGANQEEINRYMVDYNMAAEEAAEHWQKFNEGNLTEGAYAVLSELKKAWIDISNHPEVVELTQKLKDTWEGFQPTLSQIVKDLKWLGLRLVDVLNGLLSNDMGKAVVTWGAFGLIVAGIGKKLYGWAGGTKSTIDILKTLGGKIKDRIKDWRNYGDEAKKANDKANPTSTSTGGIAGETGKVSLKEELKDIGKNRLKSFANNALIIAEGMLLVTEAILLIKAPMYALSNVGEQFKAQEPQIRNGIEGLKLVAPVVGAILIPVITLHQILSKYGKFMSSWSDLWSNLKAFATMALGIAEGMLLVSEAIIMVVPSIWALGALGDQYSNIEAQVHKGTEAMKVVADSLMYLAPFIPALAIGVATVALAFENPVVAGVIGVGVTLGIPLGMLWVAETIWSLEYPLSQIASLGSKYPDLSSVKQGTEAIKITAEALGYVNDAMISLTGIDLNLLAQSIADVVASWFGVDLNSKLTDLTKEDGVLTQLNDFVKAFNSEKFDIVPPDQDKVANLGLAGDGVKTIGDAMGKVKTAMDNLPDEFKNKQNTGEQLGITGNNTDSTSSGTTDVEGYFDQFKEPIKQLKSFIHDFNTSDEFAIEKIDDTRVSNLSSSADMIVTVNDAVEKVKTTMQNIGDSGHAAAFAEGGWFGATGYDIFHMTGANTVNNGQGSGDYISSLGSQLKEMEDVVTDIYTFQSNINSIAGSEGENANVDGATAMVSTIQDAISKLAQSLSDAVPTMEGKGNAISQAIIKGINTGLEGLPNIPSKIANKVMNNKDALYNTANSLGKTTADKFKTGVAPMSDHMANEMKYTNDALNGNWHDTLGTSAYNLGQYVSTQYKNGLDMNSPGLMARTTQEEVGYIGDALNINNLPQMAYGLAESLSSTFSGAFNLSNIQLPDLSAWTSKIQTVVPTISGIKTQVSTNFNAMKTNVQNSFNSIASKTQSSLSSMKSGTLKHIGNIKTSWRGMQDALIASADHIKTQTSKKINKLKTNLGEFWNKIKHPDQLLSGVAGGKPQGTIPQRFAGSSIFKQVISRKDPSDYEEQGMICRMKNNGNPCYSGSWDFNWTPTISGKFKNWKTHFAKFNLDSHLNVGKFEHSNFPVKGKVDVFKDYISAVIGSTEYDYYYNSMYSPVEALRRGAFNCWDGTQIILGLANAFGLSGSIGHGTWGKDGHVWANIPGIGVIDPTAIQRGYGFKSPKVKGYNAGSKPHNSNNMNTGESQIVHHHGDTVVNINAPVYGVEDLDKAIEDGVNKAKRKLFKNYSGV